jgi:hypothetical protein
MACGGQEKEQVKHLQESRCPGTIGFHCVGPEGAVVDIHGVCMSCKMCWVAWDHFCQKECVNQEDLRNDSIQWRESFSSNLVRGPVQAFVEVYYFSS